MKRNKSESEKKEIEEDNEGFNSNENISSNKKPNEEIIVFSSQDTILSTSLKNQQSFGSISSISSCSINNSSSRRKRRSDNKYISKNNRKTKNNSNKDKYGVNHNYSLRKSGSDSIQYENSENKDSIGNSKIDFLFSHDDTSYISINSSPLKRKSLDVSSHIPSKGRSSILKSNTQSEHSLNSLVLPNTPSYSTKKIKEMLTTKSSIPKNIGIISHIDSIPKTLSSVSSYGESTDSLSDKQKSNLIIIPDNLEVVNSLSELQQQYNIEKKSNQEENEKEKSDHFSDIIIAKRRRKKYSFIGLVVQINSCETVHTKKGKEIDIFGKPRLSESIEISSIMISDGSKKFFPVIFWRNNSRWIKNLECGDIVLFVNLTLKEYRNKIMANTVDWGNNSYSSKYFKLYNINDKLPINLDIVNKNILAKVYNIQSWAKQDLFIKTLMKLNDVKNQKDINQKTKYEFLTIKQIDINKNKNINIQGIPIRIMKIMKNGEIDEKSEIEDNWNVDIVDIENNIISIQISTILSDLLQYIHWNEKCIYNFYNLNVTTCEESIKYILKATKSTVIVPSNNISVQMRERFIKNRKSIEPMEFNTIESIIKSRYNGLVKVKAYISKIIINRTDKSRTIEFPISTAVSKPKHCNANLEDILSTIQINCKECNEILLHTGHSTSTTSTTGSYINILTLIQSINYKDTKKQKIKYIKNIINQAPFAKHKNHLHSLEITYSQIRLVLQDIKCCNCSRHNHNLRHLNKTDHTHSSSLSTTETTTTSATTESTEFSSLNSLMTIVDKNSIRQLFEFELIPEQIIKGYYNNYYTENVHFDKNEIIKLDEVLNDEEENSEEIEIENSNNNINIDSNSNNNNDCKNSNINNSNRDNDISKIKSQGIIDDILLILSMKDKPKQDLETNKKVLHWNNLLNKHVHEKRKKKSEFILACNIEEDKSNPHIFNARPIYVKNIEEI